jgi:isocitrate dehydrogenase
MRKLDKPTVIPYLVGMGIGKDFVDPVVRLINRLHSHYYGSEPVWKINDFTTEGMTRQNYVERMAPLIEFLRDEGYGIKGPFEIAPELPSINVYLRKQLDLYACVRPVSYFDGAPSPVKHPENVNVTIFRENTEDIYAGIGFLPGSDEAIKFESFLVNELGLREKFRAKDAGFAIKFASPKATQRITKAAIDYAIKNGKTHVTIIAKHNIDKAVEAFFRKWAFDFADAEYAGRVFTTTTYEAIKKLTGKADADEALAEAKKAGKIIVDSLITDNAFQQLLLHPERYEVLVSTNMTGDYLSDFMAAQVGGLGIAPGANINYETGVALFEATHGTAPDIAGMGIANPSSVLLSFVMLFDHLGLNELAEGLRKGIRITIANNFTTGDLYRTDEGGVGPLTTVQYCATVGEMAIYGIRGKVFFSAK